MRYLLLILVNLFLPCCIFASNSDSSYARKAIIAKEEGFLQLRERLQNPPFGEEEMATIKNMITEQGVGLFLADYDYCFDEAGGDKKTLLHLVVESGEDNILRHMAELIEKESANASEAQKKVIISYFRLQADGKTAEQLVLKRKKHTKDPRKKASFNAMSAVINSTINRIQSNLHSN